MLRSDIYNIITKKEAPKNELFDNILNEGEFKALIIKGSDGKTLEKPRVVNFGSAETMKNAIKKGTHKPIDSQTTEKPASPDTTPDAEKPQGFDVQKQKDTETEPQQGTTGDDEDTSYDYDDQLNQEFEERAPRLKEIMGSISEFFSRGDGDSQRQNIIDRDAKEGGLRGEVSAPGNFGSVINEISTGYALEELIKNPSLTNEELENLVIEKIKEIDKKGLDPEDEEYKEKLKKLKNKDYKGYDEFVKSSCNAAKTEYFRTLDEIEKGGFDTNNLSISHIWGSKTSLENTVKYLEENGLDVNGKNIEEYRKIIEEGGQGENSTDTMILITDGEKNSILHTSNKKTSGDLQGNSSPEQNMETILGYIDEQFGQDSAAYKKAKIHTEETKEALREQQEQLTKYISEKTSTAKDELGKWIENAKKVSKSKDKDGNPTPDAYWQQGVVNRYYGPASLNKNGPIQNLESLIENLKKNKVDVNEKELEKVVAIIQEIKERGKIKKDEDIDLSSEQEEKIAKLYIFEMEYGGQDEEHMDKITKPMWSLSARTLLDEPKEIKAFYDRQLEIQNEYKNKLNEIQVEGKYPDNSFKPPLGLGDELQSRLFCERLHLNLSTGHNPGGIPNENFASVFGLNESRLKIDEKGNLWVGKGEKNSIEYYPYNMETGKVDYSADFIKSSELQKNGLKSGDEGIIANKETIARALGFDETPIPDDFYKNIRVGDLEPSKGNTGNSLIYRISREGEQVPVGSQTVRSKKGVGGIPQDTVKFEKEFQTSLAIASHIWHQRFKNISK